ncbi:YehS family protein [Tepidibacter sp. Z1-5]|uniref:DUF1456 family protein n=1 Tax=Tepidibacter sp. Z1-5 TaxID=3134138 RepID=UPI0030C37D58
MNNNEILIRLRDALDIKNTDMVEIFKLGGIELTSEEVNMMLIEEKDSEHNEVDNNQDIEEKKANLECNNYSLESFLNGLIIFKRGEPDPIPGKPKNPPLSIMSSKSVNNVMLKKLKIALSLTAEDMIDIFEEAGVIVTKGELSPLFRKEGHKHYKKCSDIFAINFLDGLAIKNRI